MSTMAKCEQCGERFDYASGSVHSHVYIGSDASSAQIEEDAVEGGKVYYSTGATRSSDVEGLRYDLITPYGMRALARIYCEGGKIHGDRNWENGQPESAVLTHAFDHLMKYMQGERGVAREDHLAKMAWAMFALIHYRDSETVPKEEGNA